MRTEKIMLSIENLNLYYGDSHTLWNVNMKISQGSCVVVMGRNGVGKTSLMRGIMGIAKLKSGSVNFNGADLARKRCEERARAGVAYVPQGREIFAQLSVEENLRIGLRKRNAEIPKHIFEWFPVLKEMLHRRGGDLSGGQQQQLALGRALAIRPKLIILDEPTEGIQPNIVREICETIERLRVEENITVLLVEQKLSIARRLGQEYYIMNRGRVAANGNMADLCDEEINKFLKV